MKRFLSLVCSLLVLLLTLWTLPAPVQAAFPDVSPGSWYEVPVNALAASGALTGLPDGGFHPDAVISAAEFVTMAARQAGLPPVSTASSHWSAGWLQAALDAAWYDWDELPPTGETFDQPIFRQLAVKVVMKSQLPSAHGEYADWQPHIHDFSSLNGRYYDVVFAAYASGVVTGDENGDFRPAASLTRAEACALLYRAAQQNTGTVSNPTPSALPAVPTPTHGTTSTTTGGVSAHGWLHVDGVQLCGEKGEPVVLRGMSTHGLQWFPEFASASAIRSTADYGANVFRVAMYTAEGGYLTDASLAERAFAAVDAAIQQDLYVILDWHILSDGNPLTSEEQAAAFFDRAARRYADVPNVLYEICNEPNGDITWTGNVKPYAERILRVIRNNSPKAIILVGSPTWSQDLHEVMKEPLTAKNIMYTCHFYAGTHGAWLRERIDTARGAGIPVFISEWGTSRADGTGGVFLKEAAEWLDFLEVRGISWCNWSLCGKAESSAALRAGVNPNEPWGETELSESGQFVFSRFHCNLCTP